MQAVSPIMSDVSGRRPLTGGSRMSPSAAKVHSIGSILTVVSCVFFAISFISSLTGVPGRYLLPRLQLLMPRVSLDTAIHSYILVILHMIHSLFGKRLTMSAQHPPPCRICSHHYQMQSRGPRVLKARCARLSFRSRGRISLCRRLRIALWFSLAMVLIAR